MLDQFLSFLFMFFIYLIFLMCLILILNCCLFSFVFVSFSTKTFTFRKFIYGCLFGGRLGFSPRWGPLSFSPSQFVQFSCAHCGDSRGSECPWATLWLSPSCTKIVFWGLSEFQPKLSLLLSPPTNISLSLKTKHQARLSVTGQHFAGIKQWPKGLLGRGCLHQLLWKYSPMYLCATPLSL